MVSFQSDCDGQVIANVAEAIAATNEWSPHADPVHWLPPEDPKPPLCLPSKGFKEKQPSQDAIARSSDIADDVVDRLGLFTQKCIEKTLQKHHEELLSNMRLLISLTFDDKFSGARGASSIAESSDKMRPGGPGGPGGSATDAAKESIASPVQHKHHPHALCHSDAASDVESLLKIAMAEMLDHRWMARSHGQRRIKLLDDLVRSLSFELTMAVAVCLNAIFIGWETSYTAAHPNQTDPPFIVLTSYCFTCCFLIELILRFGADWWSFVWAADHRTLMWNYLDIFIVAASIVETMLDFKTYRRSASSQVYVSNMRVIRIIRMLRLVKLLRITRLVRFVRSLRTLIYSIMWSLQSVFWAMVLMASIMYVFAIMFTQAATSHRMIAEITSGNPEIPDLYRFWGSVRGSMFSLFMSIAGGISWIEVVEPLTSLNEGWRYMFLVYIGFTYFVFVNVVTGVFCQAAVEGHAEDSHSMVHTVRRHHEIFTARFKELFTIMDADHSGRITLDEFLNRMEDEAVKDFFLSFDLSCADALCLFDLFEDAATKGVHVDEFILGCLRLKGFAKSSDIVRLMYDQRELNDNVNRILDHFHIASCRQLPKIGDLNLFMSETLGELSGVFGRR